MKNSIIYHEIAPKETALDEFIMNEE